MRISTLILAMAIGARTADLAYAAPIGLSRYSSRRQQESITIIKADVLDQILSILWWI
ncbi:hypothetical protein QVD99_005519 [Batrachochytrium dendrobatidis]|nr:hypothetical protein O5D80_002365 [Batrachochytrium dendrobatidis]KAK5668502.1 hypothetical protein QVD99_005519 [Batrachochytrium dendrobatidis]